MSLFSKTSLEEYARQCTLQRRRYEECLEQSQQNYTVRVSAMPAGAIDQKSQLDDCTDQARQSCMMDLLEMPVEPISWDGDDLALDDAKQPVPEAHLRHDDRARLSYRAVVNPSVKSRSPVSYGAP